MTALPATLSESWAALRAVEDACPWPGLRSIEDGPRVAQLKGRETDTVDVIYEIRDHRLTVLFGDSGVGKTSLLAARVIPKLRDEGFKVVRFREWRKVAGDVRTYLESHVIEKLREGGFDALNERYGRRFVLVLDQFEEFIRHQPELSELVQAWVVDATKRYDFRIVIALRSEYEHRLRTLKTAPYQRVDLFVGAVEQKFVREIVKDGRNTNADQAISPAAVEVALALWVTAKGGESWTKVGLPHLQALLYTLWGDVKKEGREVIEAADVVFFVTRIRGRQRLPSGMTEKIAQEAFDVAVRRAVDIGLEHATNAFTRIGDPYLTAGVRSQVARMARMLSSGGFKVDQDRWPLARQVLSDEIRTLQVAEEDASRIFHQMAWTVDAEHKARREGSSEPGVDWLNLGRLPFVNSPWEREEQGFTGEDPYFSLEAAPLVWVSNEATSGPMMDLPPEHALVEEFRRFFLALEWLDEAAVVRQSNVHPRRTIVVLTHDAIGRGLEEWATRHESDPESDLRILSARHGRRIDWDVPVHGEGAPLVVANLRWRACHVKVEFRDVVFLNCDFRESVFDGCTFAGTVFVNCILDGVTFRGCTVTGAVGDLTIGEDEPPRKERRTFYVEAPDEAAVIARYRERGEAIPSGLRSKLGPALPEPRAEGDRDISPYSGGLFLLGSRLSSLMFAECTFEPGSAIGILHSSGTSLEFAEQGAGDLYLRDVSLRGFSVSRVYSRSGDPGATFNIRFAQCLAGNIWISAGVRGGIDFVDSLVWQALNAGFGDDFAFSFDDKSQGFGLINSGPTPPGWSGDIPDALGLGGQSTLIRHFSRQTDYIRDADVIDDDDPAESPQQ